MQGEMGREKHYLWAGRAASPQLAPPGQAAHPPSVGTPKPAAEHRSLNDARHTNSPSLEQTLLQV